MQPQALGTKATGEKWLQAESQRELKVHARQRDRAARRTTRGMLPLADIIYLTTRRSYDKFFSKLIYDPNLSSPKHFA